MVGAAPSLSPVTPHNVGVPSNSQRHLVPLGYIVQSTLTIRIWLGPGQIILITSYSYGEHP